MKALLLFVLIAVVVAIVYFYYKKMQARPKVKDVATPKVAHDPFEDPFAEKNFNDLTPSQMVKLDDVDYFVRRVVEMREGDYTWREFKLGTGLGNDIWLSVEDDDGLDLGIWKELSLDDIQSGKPGDQAVTISGKAFALKESGSASWTELYKETPKTGHMQYHQYEAADGTMLALQRYEGAQWEASRGNRRRTADFDIYPANS